MNTVKFYPSKYKMPTLSTKAIAVKAAVELTESLQNISTIFTDIASSKVFESMSDKQLPRVEIIFPYNSIKNRITLQMVNFRGWTCR